MRFQLPDAGAPIGSFSAYVKMALRKDVWVGEWLNQSRDAIAGGQALERQRMDIIKNRGDLWDGNPFGQSILAAGGDLCRAV